jgi:hypothetical protein
VDEAEDLFVPRHGEQLACRQTAPKCVWLAIQNAAKRAGIKKRVSPPFYMARLALPMNVSR